MKLNNRDLRTDNLKNSQWIGIVENTDDDLFEGRIKVRVFGKMDQRTDPGNPNSDYVLPTEAIPWARPAVSSSGGSSSGSGTFSVPKIGSIIRVTFDNGNYYSPVYHENVYPSNEVKEEIQESYPNAHIILYDTGFGLVNNNGEITNERDGEGVKIFFTEASGIVMDYATTEGSSIINIKPDNSIELSNPNGDSIIMLNDGTVNINCTNANINADGETHINSPRIKLGEQAAESVIKGDTFKTIFDNHIHPTYVGPSGPPTTSASPALSKKNTTD